MERNHFMIKKDELDMMGKLVFAMMKACYQYKFDEPFLKQHDLDGFLPFQFVNDNQ